MNRQVPTSEYLVLSRGVWDKGTTAADIQTAIDRFYDWYERNIREGRMKAGSRLTREAALVSRSGIVTDGPFSEAKEVVGGYWFIIASNLREAAEIAAENPCARYGLTFEVRPLESKRASADEFTNETPSV